MRARAAGPLSTRGDPRGPCSLFVRRRAPARATLQPPRRFPPTDALARAATWRVTGGRPRIGATGSRLEPARVSAEPAVVSGVRTARCPLSCRSVAVLPAVCPSPLSLLMPHPRALCSCGGICRYGSPWSAATPHRGAVPRRRRRTAPHERTSCRAAPDFLSTFHLWAAPCRENSADVSPPSPPRPASSTPPSPPPSMAATPPPPQSAPAAASAASSPPARTPPPPDTPRTPATAATAAAGDAPAGTPQAPAAAASVAADAPAAAAARAPPSLPLPLPVPGAHTARRAARPVVPVSPSDGTLSPVSAALGDVRGLRSRLFGHEKGGEGGEASAGGGNGGGGG